MLAPEDRHLLTDALRPPAGFSVDAALATTYTLDLHSLLLAPLAMAAYDHTEGDGAAIDAATPVALLESIRRHADRTIVLCQAAGIHVPPTYPRLAAFAEGMVAEVPPPPGGTFHPKIWVLRFIDATGSTRHRFVCLSRNLTGDRSWDTVLVCDEDSQASAVLDPAPVATFVSELLGMLVRPLDGARRDLVDDLCRTFADARLSIPSPSPQRRRSAGCAVRRFVAHAAAGAVARRHLAVPREECARRLPRTAGRRVVLSRADGFDRVGGAACRGRRHMCCNRWQTSPRWRSCSMRLTRGGAAGHGGSVAWSAREDLLLGRGKVGHVLTGSANCTGAAFGGNIEMSVLLSGPKGTAAPTPCSATTRSGLLRLTQPLRDRRRRSHADPTYAAERRIEAWHAALAATEPVLEVEAADDEYDLRLRLQLPDDPHGSRGRDAREAGRLEERPARSVTEPLPGTDSALHALSPYLVLSPPRRSTAPRSLASVSSAGSRAPRGQAPASPARAAGPSSRTSCATWRSCWATSAPTTCSTGCSKDDRDEGREPGGAVRTRLQRSGSDRAPGPCCRAGRRLPGRAHRLLEDLATTTAISPAR